MFRKLQLYIIEAIGALLLTAFLFLPGDSLSESDLHMDAEGIAAADSSGAIRPAPWIEIAERLESRRDYRGALDLMSRVIARESGNGRVEARLWRAQFAARLGLYERAGAALDSLALESGPWPQRLKLSAAEGAFDMALLRDDLDAAREALKVWRQSRGSNPDPAIDSLEASLNARLGTALLIADTDLSAAAGHFEDALALGLPAAEVPLARFRHGVTLSRADSTGRAIDVLGALLADTTFANSDSTLALRAAVELADLLYRSGEYAESRRRYEAALPFVTTPADSGWVLVQLGDALAHLGSGRDAHDRYTQYLDQWPEGTWASWARSGAADLDTTAAEAVMGPMNLEMEP